MNRVETAAISSASIAFPEIVGRLRLTQREVKLLLAIDKGAAVVVPHPQGDSSRLDMVTAALSEVLLLVGDDELVGRWLRAPMARRGGASPLEEAALAEGRRQIGFVLRPDPIELVRLVAAHSLAIARGSLRHRPRGSRADA